MAEETPSDWPHPSCYVIHEVGVAAHEQTVTVHAEYGLILVLDGWFTMEQRYEALSTSGSVTIVPAGVPHRPLAGENINYWLLGFTASSFGFEESQAIMRPFNEIRLGAAPVIKLTDSAIERLTDLFERLHKEVSLQTAESTDVQRSLITLILAEAGRSSPPATEGSQTSSLVSKALRYIQQNSLTPISLADVAEAVGRSRPHVASVVKAETGFTVGTWITSARVAKAAQLLEHTELTIDQIAPLIGWQDTTHFIRQFRKIYGVTPASWRKGKKSSI